jgi:ubiquinone/menaquinone biosynthesis C-methylase UbiE
MRSRTGVAIVVFALAGWMFAAAQSAAPGVHPISGRVIAQVMGYQGADWLDRNERVLEEEPDRALDALDIKRGWTVADVGAGTGYMSVKLARRVGTAGRVYAEDIQPQMIERLTRRLTQDRVTNVTPVLGTVDDPRLPADQLDLILMVDVYHELSAPQNMLRALRPALKTGGRLVLLEYRKEDPSIPIREEHKMSIAVARQEVEAEAFRFVKVDGRLPRQHILIFEK